MSKHTWHENTPLHTLSENEDHKCHKLESDKGRRSQKGKRLLEKYHLYFTRVNKRNKNSILLFHGQDLIHVVPTKHHFKVKSLQLLSEMLGFSRLSCQVTNLSRIYIRKLIKIIRIFKQNL